MMKINKIAGTLAFLAATALSSTASASVYTVDFDSNGLYTNSVDTPVGAVSDTYNFAIGLSGGDTLGSASNHILTTVQNIGGFNFSIYDASNATMFSGGSNETAFLSLAAGTYHAVVSGIASGSSGGKYSVSIYTDAPASVPVPAALWLLGSGLIGLVGVARRKEQA